MLRIMPRKRLIHLLQGALRSASVAWRTGAMNMGIIAEIAVVPAALFALLLGALPTPATAQPYPERPLKILVGGAPGSVPDAMIRPIAEQLSVSLGQPVVVENKPGAAGVVARQALPRAAPRGCTHGGGSI